MQKSVRNFQPALHSDLCLNFNSSCFSKEEQKPKRFLPVLLLSLQQEAGGATREVTEEVSGSKGRNPALALGDEEGRRLRQKHAAPALGLAPGGGR